MQIIAENLTYIYSEKTKSLAVKALDNISLTINEGEFFGVIGHTGSGKTTFLNALSQFIPKDQRIITIEDSAELRLMQIENLVRGFSGVDSLMGHSEDEMRKLSFGEIECITILDRKVIAIDTKGTQYRIQNSLRNLEAALPSYFIRINKSTLANEHRILRFDAAFSGGVDAVFQCGYREYVSRRCFAEIKRRLEGK